MLRYEQHFGFKYPPFDSSPKADQIYLGSGLTEAATRIDHLVKRMGVGILTGEPGSGKTTACRRTAQALPPGQYRICYVSFSTGSALDTRNTIAQTFGLPWRHRRAHAWEAIREQIKQLSSEQRQSPVLIFDEAHLLRDDSLDQLRLLLNFEMDATNRLALILVGLSELDRRLTMARHQSLAQRLIVRHQMALLTAEEIESCVTHRLTLAGVAKQSVLFLPPAMEAIRLGSKGIPRLVNHLAHFSLLAAAQQNSPQVTPEHVELAAGELNI